MIYILGKFFLFCLFCLFVSYVILYMFQCHPHKSSHPLPLPQSPKDCSMHLYLFYLRICLRFTDSVPCHLHTAFVPTQFGLFSLFGFFVFCVFFFFGSNFLVIIFNSFYFISEISLFFQLFQDAFKMFIE